MFVGGAYEIFHEVYVCRWSLWDITWSIMFVGGAFVGGAYEEVGPFLSDADSEFSSFKAAPSAGSSNAPTPQENNQGTTPDPALNR